MKKSLFQTIVFALFLVTIIFVITIALKKGETKYVTLKPLPNHMILFYSHQCPHCQLVEAFLQQHPVKKPLEQLDILGKNTHTSLLINAAQTCKLNTNTIGIPLLWTGKNCIVGDRDIINYFKKIS